MGTAFHSASPKRLTEDPLGGGQRAPSADGLGGDGPDGASRRQSDRCVAEAQHMLYEGLGLARTLWHAGASVACVHS